jgi:hypothetical protein
MNPLNEWQTRLQKWQEVVKGFCIRGFLSNLEAIFPLSFFIGITY